MGLHSVNGTCKPSFADKASVPERDRSDTPPSAGGASRCPVDQQGRIQPMTPVHIRQRSPAPTALIHPCPMANAPNARHLKSNKGGGTAPRDAAAFSNPTVDSPTFSFRWDGAIQFIEPAGAFPQRSSYQPTGGTTTEHSLVCASNRSRYRKRRARTLLYPHNPSDTPPVSVAVTLRLF